MQIALIDYVVPRVTGDLKVLKSVVHSDHIVEQVPLFICGM